MAMSKSEFSALLTTMDVVVSLCETVKVNGTPEQMLFLRTRYEQLKHIRDIAKE